MKDYNVSHELTAFITKDLAEYKDKESTVDIVLCCFEIEQLKDYKGKQEAINEIVEMAIQKQNELGE